jgi:hypothetical protein
MLDAEECRELANSCIKQAAEATDPMVSQRLSETAQGWARLTSPNWKMVQEQQHAA